MIKAESGNSRNRLLWCLAGENSILKTWNPATLPFFFVLVIPNFTLNHLTLIDLANMGELVASGTYMPFFLISLSVAVSADGLLSIGVPGGTGGGFFSSHGTGFYC